MLKETRELLKTMSRPELIEIAGTLEEIMLTALAMAQKGGSQNQKSDTK